MCQKKIEEDKRKKLEGSSSDRQSRKENNKMSTTKISNKSSKDSWKCKGIRKKCPKDLTT